MIQTIIALAIVALAAGWLFWSWLPRLTRKASQGGCGGSCGETCSRCAAKPADGAGSPDL